MALDGFFPIRDVVGEGLALIPGSLRGENTDLVTEGALIPFSEVELTIAGLTLALDPTIATGFQLTQAGERVGEPRGGINDDDLYRRLVLGRISAMNGGGTWRGIVQCWRALAGNPNQWVARRVPVAGDPCIALFALVDFLPDRNWIARASAILRDSTAVGVEVYGILGLNSAFTLIPGGGLGFGGGTWSVLIQ